MKGSEKKMKKKHPILKAIKIVLLVLVCLIIIAGTIGYQMIGALFTRALTVRLDVDSPNAKAVQAVSKLDVEKIEEEGIVLLKNTNNLLPLSKGTKLSVFGTGSVKSVFGGGGSGSADTSNAVSLKKGLENSDFVVSERISNFYANWVNSGVPSVENSENVDTSQASGIEQTVVADYNINEVPVTYLTDNIMNIAKEDGDVAIVVISRTGSEGTDLSYGYLKPSEDEISMIERVCENFSDVIVLLNIVNPMETGFVESYPQIKAVLNVGAVGNTGMNAIGRILSGDANPSGRLVDTYAYDLMSAPANVMIGSEGWGSNEYAYDNLEGTYFINYYEGIYVGYRYYETRYAGDENGYKNAVQYPFGYGLSYTNFEQKLDKLEENGDIITATVSVKNKGLYPGKDVVQIYYSAPAGTNDGIERSVVNLCAFSKTKELAPLEAETLTLSWNLRDMANYDAKGTGTWKLCAGDYEIRLSQNSHEVISSESVNVPQEKYFSEDEVTGTEVVSRFSDAEGDITYVSSTDFEGTFPDLSAVSKTASDEVVQAFNNEIEYDNTVEKPVTGKKNDIMFSELTDAEYDDEKWNAFLDQLTVKEMATLIASGGYGTAGIKRLGVPKKIDMDGPAAINNIWAQTSGVQFPAGITIAQTWNTDMAFLAGKDIAIEAVTYGVYGWYAPGANLHRSAFGGRNFEYFSEDPLLSGKMAASEITAATEQGVVCYLKHFVMNEQENNRNNNGLYTWCNEQAIRELYLKPFEIAVKEGKPLGVMSSFNRIGSTWTGASSALLKDVLRDEWGFEGVVVSDATQSLAWKYMDQQKGVMNGNDMFLNYSAPMDTRKLAKAGNKNPELLQAMRKACHNILYSVAKSNVK